MPKVFNRVGREYNDFCIIVGEPEIGEETWIGFFTIIDGSGGLKIGKHCSIASGTAIYTHDSIRWSIENLEKDYGDYTHIDRKPVEIGDNCFIGHGTIILPGVEIGHHSVIGAGSVVTKSIPPFSIARGVPARIVGKVLLRDERMGFVELKEDRKNPIRRTSKQNKTNLNNSKGNNHSKYV